MGFGTKTREGSLPVFKVGSEEEARRLIVMACPTNFGGEYIAPELAEAQTIENLEKFSTRLDVYHDIMIQNGLCTCKAAPKRKNANKAK